MLLRSSASARYFAGFPIGFNVILGGQTRDGADATNLLSYMCLRAQADVGMTQPNLSIRIHRDSPQQFLRAAEFRDGRGGGMPQVFNDEVIIPGQIGRGVDPDDARDYAVVGCVELSTPGKALGWSDASMFNMTRVLELTLYGGRDPDPHLESRLQQTRVCAGTANRLKPRLRRGFPIRGSARTPPLDQLPDFAALEAVRRSCSTSSR